ncbi:MAG: NAD(+)/NADH kinase [Chloroflexi bacterium]|nr:NAD(+)/NADH kinase [Chloroflexota bacterium]
MHKIGVLYHPRVPATLEAAQQIRESLAQSGVSVWVASAWDEDDARRSLDGTDALISLGGDGTILRAARIGVERGVPIAGVNYGRVGFLSEYQPQDVPRCLSDLLEGRYWLDERMMLHCELWRAGKILVHYDALNDVVIGRGTVARVVRLRLSVDGQLPIRLVADGVIVSTPTGSTAYTVAAGGPIADPRVRVILVTPIAPHLSVLGSLVLPDTSTIEIAVDSDYPALVSMDGQIEMAMEANDVVRVKTSRHVSRFVRTQSQEYFYTALTKRFA